MFLINALAVGSGDPIDLWGRVQGAWETGGLAFFLFIALLLLFTGRVTSGRDRDRAIADWKARYEENDKRWESRYNELKARTEASDQMLYRVMGWGARVTSVAERVADKVLPPSDNSAPGPP